jgi:hypothetical protein
MNMICKILLFLFLSSLYYLPLAGNNYYWLLKIRPNLRTFISGLGKTPLAEGGLTVKPEMHFYHLNKDYLEKRISKGPNPQVDNGWNIRKLIDLNWQNLPKTKITTLNNQPSYYHSSPDSVTQEQLQDLKECERLISAISPTRNIFSRSGCFLNNATDYLNTPWVNLHSAIYHFDLPVKKLIEIKAKDFPLTDELIPIPPFKLSPQKGSLLMSTIDEVLLKHQPDDSVFDPNVANLLSALDLDEDILLSALDSDIDILLSICDDEKNATQKEHLFFCPALKSYLQFFEKSQSATTLIPHDTMIKLGLIPGASYENETHMNPDNWGYEK